MCAKIIDSRRYKTITKSQLEKKRKKSEKELRVKKNNYKNTNKYSTINNDNNSFISNLRIKKHRERKREQELLLYSRPQKTVLKEPKQKIYIPKSFVISCCVLIMVFLVFISIKITRVDEKITASVFNNSDDKSLNSEVNLETNYDLKIGLTSLDSTDVYKSSNLIVNDLLKKTSYSLVKFENNYDIKYQLAKNIVKVSNLEYIVTLNDKYKLDIDDLKYSLDKILSYGESNMYYSRLNNILSLDSTENKDEVKITLKEENPYFVYCLDFPVTDDEEKVKNEFEYSVQDNSILFTKTKVSSNKSLNSIMLKNYNGINDSVEAFSNDEIDVFFATSNNDMQLIGQKDYSVKKYKDGETLFILGNKNSTVFSKKELRTALMYSLNRDEIVKTSDNNFIEIIDLPFIYSSIKYKYDIVGAKNIMNSNGWSQNASGIYEKTEDGNYLTATLRLLVNSQDENKMNIANNIKTMAYNAGINIEIIALTADEIEQRVESLDYDIVLSTIYLNETPDIRFLQNYLDINDATNQAFKQVEQSSVEELPQNVQNLEYVLSDEVACIGIYARNINLVYQKYIYGFNDINYMSIFNDINNIGKIIN